jgi:hypothetical protein
MNGIKVVRGRQRSILSLWCSTPGLDWRVKRVTSKATLGRGRRWATTFLETLLCSGCSAIA